MATESLIHVVETLTPQEQDAVRQFIGYLKDRDARSPYLRAADEFMAEHPEILHRLSQ